MATNARGARSSSMFFLVVGEHQEAVTPGTGWERKGWWHGGRETLLGTLPLGPRLDHRAGTSIHNPSSALAFPQCIAVFLFQLPFLLSWAWGQEFILHLICSLIHSFLWTHLMVARTVVTQHDPGDRVGSSSSGLELKAGGGEGRGGDSICRAQSRVGIGYLQYQQNRCP